MVSRYPGTWIPGYHDYLPEVELVPEVVRVSGVQALPDVHQAAGVLPLLEHHDAPVGQGEGGSVEGVFRGSNEDCLGNSSVQLFRQFSV